MNFRKLWHTFAFWGLILSFGVTSCTPSQPAQTQAFQVQANKANAQAKPNPGKGQKKLPKATVYQVGNSQIGPLEGDGFSTQALGLPAPTACYECRWKALNVNASYITADFAPASDGLSLGHPDLSHPNAGYHFALNPLETGFDANGNKIVTRLKVYLRVVAYREAPTYKERREFFSRYLVASENSFVSTDGINYEFEGRADYDATINMSYAKDSAYCETTNTEAMGPASGGYVKLNPDTGEAEVSVQASVPARARVYSGCYSPMKYKYGNNTLNMKVTADINYEDPTPEPTPTPTPVPTATPTIPMPTPSPTPVPTSTPSSDFNFEDPCLQAGFCPADLSPQGDFSVQAKKTEYSVPYLAKQLASSINKNLALAVWQEQYQKDELKRSEMLLDLREQAVIIQDIKTQPESTENNRTLKKLEKKFGKKTAEFLEHGQKMLERKAMIIYLNNKECLPCVVKVIDELNLAKKTSGMFEIEVAHVLQSSGAFIKGTRIPYQLPEPYNGDNYEMDIETREYLIEVTKSLELDCSFGEIGLRIA